MSVKEMSVFPVGEKNEAFAQYFVGQSYLNMLSTQQVSIGNVTFEPGCRNNWHIHHAKNHGVTREEIAEILTHAAFYAGWPKAWAAFRMAKEVWEEA